MASRVTIQLPEWVAKERDPELRITAENAYSSQAFAVAIGADQHPRCTRLMAAALEALHRLEDTSLPLQERLAAGKNAATNFGAARMLLTDQGTPPRL